MNDEALKGTPAQVAEQILVRYEPLRSSRAHCEPEQAQRKLWKLTAYLLGVGGLGVEILLLATGRVSVPGVVFGLVVAGIGALFYRAANQPLKFTPPEPLENLPALSQGLGLCRGLEESFPTMKMEFDPTTSILAASHDGRDFRVRVNREGLKPVNPEDAQHENTYTVMAETSVLKPRIYRRSSHAVNRQRVAWTVAVEGDFRPRPGQPGEHTSLESRDYLNDKTECVFALPINFPDKPGLGHEGRTDYISSPMGLHHPEFVGEQVALSLVWLFAPTVRL